MNKRELIQEKLNNFKKLLRQKVSYKTLEPYQKIQNYTVDDIILFASQNVAQYKLLGLDIVVQTFFQYLEMDYDDEELRGKIQMYFEFFIEILDL